MIHELVFRLPLRDRHLSSQDCPPKTNDRNSRWSEGIDHQNTRLLFFPPFLTENLYCLNINTQPILIPSPTDIDALSWPVSSYPDTPGFKATQRHQSRLYPKLIFNAQTKVRQPLCIRIRDASIFVYLIWQAGCGIGRVRLFKVILISLLTVLVVQLHICSILRSAAKLWLNGHMGRKQKTFLLRLKEKTILFPSVRLNSYSH